MFNRRCFGALLLAGLVLSFNGCNSDTGLTTIVISPSGANAVTVTLAPPGSPQGHAQFTAIGYYGHAGHQTTQDISSQVTWASSLIQVASISSSGLATATGYNPATGEQWTGVTNITASAPGFSGTVVSNSATFTVTACTSCASSDVSSITVLPATQTVATVGVPVQFEAIGKTVNGNSVVLTGVAGIQWVSSVESVGSIVAATPGQVKTSGAGTTTITANFTNVDGSGASGSATLTVAPSGSPEPLTALAVAPATLTVPVGNTTTNFIAIGTLGSGATVNLTDPKTYTYTVPGSSTTQTIQWAQWNSSNPAVASIDPNTGVINAKTAGVTVITAIATNPNDLTVVTGSAVLTVSSTSSSEPIVSVAIEPNAQTSTSTGSKANVNFIAIGTLGSGGTVQLTNAVQTINGLTINPVSWYSSNQLVASFASSASGTATPNASGATAITAVVTNPDKTQVIGTAAYTVTAASTSAEPLSAVTIYPPAPAVSVPNESSQLLAIGTFSAAPTTQDVTAGITALGGVTGQNITTNWSSSDSSVATVTTDCPTGLTAESCTLSVCPPGSTGATCSTCPAGTVAAGSSCAQLNLATPIGTVTGVSKGSSVIMAISANPDGTLVPATTTFSVLGGNSDDYTALTIYPNSQAATAPAQQSQFFVLGTKGSTGLTYDVTGLVQWCSSNAAVASIESAVAGSSTCSNVVGTSPGIATALASGNTTFSATYTNPDSSKVTVSATYAVTIGQAQEPLIAINVIPAAVTVSNRGQSAQYLAFGTYTTTPTVRDLTDMVTWYTSSPELASMESTGVSGETGGIATAMGYTGDAVIYAFDSNPDGTVVTSNAVKFTCKDPNANVCIQTPAPVLLATLTVYNTGQIYNTGENQGTWLVTADDDQGKPNLIHCGPGSETAGLGNSVCTGTYAPGSSVKLQAWLTDPAYPGVEIPIDNTFGGWSANCDLTTNTPVLTSTCAFPNAANPNGINTNTSVGAIFYSLSLSCSAVTSGKVGVAFNSGAVTVSNGTGPYVFSVVGTLPAGLTLNTSTGAVTGTPTAAGSFSITATDANGTQASAASACAITIN
jgi:hypothetical protein